ncbi:DUF1980 domain-containing protein [Candidatus Dependentiae bacterium]|nr:DUF1980 domain-containing protein [Candidatus Dependentiae bacterium]
MNLLHVIILFFFDVSISAVILTGHLSEFVHPRFTAVIYTGFILLSMGICAAFMIFFFRKLKIFFKVDFTVILLLPIFFALWSNKNINSMSLIDHKFKGKINPKKIEELKINTGLKSGFTKKTENNTVIEKNIIKDYDKNEKYRQLNILEAYNELNSIGSKDKIKKISYNIDVIGQIYYPTTENKLELYENEIMIVRFVMVCCAADMTPMGLIIENKNKYSENFEEWIRVKGKIEFIENSKIGGFFGFVRDHTIEKIDPPEIEWLYPDFSNYK